MEVQKNAAPAVEVQRLVRPVVVCLCGSSRYATHHMTASMEETLAGKIVVGMGLYGHADIPLGAKEATGDGDESGEVKQMLDRLHLAKIDLADEILVIAPGGYIGNSTRREMQYAEKQGKPIRFWHGYFPETNVSGEARRGEPSTGKGTGAGSAGN